MKLFGKNLFNFKGEPGVMYDFAQFGLLELHPRVMDFVAQSYSVGELTKSKKKVKVKEEILITPKGLYRLGALNDNKFSINADPEYIDQQVENVRAKLDFMGKDVKKPRRVQEFEPQTSGVKFGKDELKSMIERLENRKRLKEFEEVVGKYPHTTSRLINEVVEAHNHLRCSRADSFVPDFPTEAIKSMKEYEKLCIELCNKKPVFYVLANKKDFERRDKRRDPILLAQSPFGFFWQILGAWDEEMIYLEDL